MTRRPGDITPIAKSVTRTRVYTPATGSPITSTAVSTVFQDVRPSYSKGARTHFGSTQWIMPTNYTHYSREVKLPGDALFSARIKSNNKIYSIYEVNPQVDSMVTNLGFIWNNTSGIEYTNASNASKVKALNDLASNSAGLGEDLATYAQTVRLFSSKAGLLAAILNSAKRNKKLAGLLSLSAAQAAAKGGKEASSLYLEYVYGWKPLVSDVYGVYQLLKQYSAGLKPIIVHGHGKAKWPLDGVFQTPPGTNGYKSAGSYKENLKATCDLYGRVDPQIIAFRMLNQLGLLNPASIAWEVTPWSFVVDWLIPIGPVLNAFTAPIGLNFISGTAALRSSRTISGEYHVRESTTDDTLSETIIDRPVSFTVIDEKYNRGTLSTWPIPIPYLDLNPLRGDRSLKAVALAITNLLR
jgi:hypothetical protein